MASELMINQTLNPGQLLTSPDGSVTLSMEEGGNLALFVGGDPVWQSGTSGTANGPGYYLIMQGDGNLVLYQEPIQPLWASNTVTGNVQSATARVTDAGQLLVVVNGQTAATFPTAPVAGQQMVVEILDPQGNPVYQEDYAYDEADGGEGVTRRLVGRRWLDESLRPRNLPGETRESAPATTQDSLEVAKFAWTFIKENRPVVNVQNVTTSVLSSADTNPLDYQGARTGQSPTYTFLGTVYPTKLTQFKVVFYLGGTYQGSPVSTSPAPAGVYLPSVFTAVSQCDSYWPYSVNASAAVTSPSNVGSNGNVVAQVNVITSIQASSFIDSFNANVVFQGNAQSGFSLVSCG